MRALAVLLLIVCTVYAAVDCNIYTEGVLLDWVQSNHRFNDSKTFVDMPLRRDGCAILDDFQRLGPNSSYDAFMLDNFLDAGSELTTWKPADWSTSEPAFARNLSSSVYRTFASQLNALWLLLGRAIKPEVSQRPHQFSFLPVPNPFFVAGGRFREIYYWDTFWIVKGLLRCNMMSSAKLVIQNLLHLVRTYGFVPNGTRKYYLNRSQPPLLTQMVLDYYAATKDLDFVREALPMLDAEYRYWMDPAKGHTFTVTVDGKPVVLNRYSAEARGPRPESYREDVHLAEPLPSLPDKLQLYTHLASGAETGWDFSSRWFSAADPSNFLSIETQAVLPVDLNAFLFKDERDLAALHRLVGTDRSAAMSVNYTVAALTRQTAMQHVMFGGKTTREPSRGSCAVCAEDQCAWGDVDQRTLKLRHTTTIAGWLPLWAGISSPCSTAPPSTPAQRTASQNHQGFARAFAPGLSADWVDQIELLRQSGLIQPGGVVTSLVNSTQQWDFPNAWPPLQWFIIDLLLKIPAVSDQTVASVPTPQQSAGASASPSFRSLVSASRARRSRNEARELAKSLAQRWVYTNWLAFQRDSVMHEKMDARCLGCFGQGGEYVPQTGFGWSNGVVLELLYTFQDLAASAPVAT